MKLIYLLVLIVIVSCVQKPVVVSAPEEPVKVTPQPTPKVVPVTTALKFMPLSWEKGDPARADWSQYLELRIKERLHIFAAAKDIEKFCPTFKRLSEAEQVRALGEMFVRIAKWESSFNNASRMQEPPPPAGPGTVSRGLYQMSYGDGNGCPNSPAEGDLHTYKPNIDCALKTAAHFVGKYGVITNETKREDGSTKYHGMSLYWAVIRAKSKLVDIQEHVKGFCK